MGKKVQIDHSGIKIRKSFKQENGKLQSPGVTALQSQYMHLARRVYTVAVGENPGEKVPLSLSKKFTIFRTDTIS